MTTELTVSPQQHIMAGQKALRELRLMVKNRPGNLIFNGKQYLYFTDYQMLGAFFGITCWVTDTMPITMNRPSEDGKFTVIDTIGFHARAVAKQDGKEISAAEADCMYDEPDWRGKQRFLVLSMSQTRACAKVLRQCLQWVVKLPDEKSAPHIEYADESVEESQGF